MIEGATLHELIGAEAIAGRVKELGAELNQRFAGQKVLVVCVLKGAFLFYADLVRHLDFGPEIDFVRLASYGTETSTSGKVFFTKDVETDVEGKHVLIIEDIVDTGRSMDFLVRVFEQRGAATVGVCTLIDKRERRELDVAVDFAGFQLKKGFVVGYGLDYAEQYRELPGVYELQLP